MPTSFKTLPKPAPGRLADAVSKLAGEMLQEVSGDDERITIEECLEMLTTNPIASAAVEAKVLLGLSLWGAYQHEDEKLQTFIQGNFASMQGTMALSLAETLSVTPIGWAASEISYRLEKEAPAGLRLESLTILDPRLYSFRGKRSQIDDLLYKSPSGKEVAIPYGSKVLHVVNKRHLAFGSPTGVPDCRVAVAAYKAWKIIVNEALLAGQRQATPIIVGKAPPDARVQLLDPSGRPLLDGNNQPVTVPATERLATALEGLNTNGGIISVDTLHEIQALNHQTSGQFFMELLGYFERLILLAFMVPETLFQVGQGGLGNAGIAGSHLGVMMGQIRQIIEQVKDQMIEKVVRPLIEWNFGEQESYGKFAEAETEEENKLALFAAITDAIAKGTFSLADLEVVNRQRELAGLPKVDKIADGILSKNSRYFEEKAAA
jgi:hypothetical protein